MQRTFTRTLLGIAMLLAGFLQAQPDYRALMKDTAFLFPNNLKTTLEQPQAFAEEAVAGYHFRLIQFETMPTAAAHQAFQSAGLELLEYIPNFTYLAAIPTNFDLQQLTTWKVRGILPITTAMKKAQSLYERPFPGWAVQGNQLEVLLKYFKPIDAGQIVDFCKTEGIDIVRDNGINNYLRARIPMAEIDRIAQLPWVNYLEVAPPPGQAEDRWGRNFHKANLLEKHYGAGQELTGEGISVLVRDDGFIGPHADFQGRLIQEDLEDNETQHADGVAGIFSGAGNIDPDMRGMAAGALTYNIPYVSDFLDNTLPLHLEKEVLITNSSYSDTCNAFTATTQIVDQQIHENPTLLHVFSAGNSNNNDCGYGAGDQWGNITGGHKQGKNVIATANIDRSGNLATSSSRGPAFDGRIKPDIAAHGNGQFSLDDDHAYREFSGTSAAAPGVAGVSAQLYQLYQQQNGTAPESGLIKAALLNTATDLGTYGPDFRYGWGQVHALKAAQLLEQNRYLRAEIVQGESNAHSIFIPEGVREVRVMTYWMEREASDFVGKALVNDLNTTLRTPTAEFIQSLVLNPSPAGNLAAPAQPGIDNLNNVEQIRITDPVSGLYELSVEGQVVPFGVQPYFVVFEFVRDEVELVYPSGGESLVPGSRETLHWESTNRTDEFNIFYSLDGGQNWSGIATLNGATRFYDWFVPDTLSSNVVFRIQQGALTDTSAAPINFMPRPENVNVGQVCPDFVQIQWDTVVRATEYVIFKLGQRYMDSIAVTENFSYEVPVKSPKAKENWFALEARGPNGLRSRRTIAVPYDGDLVDCKQEKDFSITSLQLEENQNFAFCSNEQPIQVVVKNKGLQAQDSIQVAFQLNEQPPVFEWVPDTLLAGDSLVYQFANNFRIDSTDEYLLKIWTNAEDEDAAFNDTLFFENKLVLLEENQLIPIDSINRLEEEPENWLIINPDDAETWSTAFVPGFDNSRSIAIAMYNPFYGDIGIGQRDAVQTAQFDLRTADTTALAFAFDLAYGYVGSANFADTLQIEISTDCGATYQTIYKKGGEELATLTTQSFFVPNGAQDWRREFVDISDYREEQVLFKITNISAVGNNLFLDNIGVEYLMPPEVTLLTPTEALCRQQELTFTTETSGSVSTYTWEFGSLSRPPIAYGPGPHVIDYVSDGEKEVVLRTTSPFGNDTIATTIELSRVPRARFDFTQNGSEIIFVNDSRDAGAYIWDFGDGTTSAEENPVHNYNNTGIFQVEMTAVNECGEDTEEKEVIIEVVGVGNTPPPFAVQLSPNPTSGDFWLQLEQVPFSELQFQLLTINGKIVQQQQLAVANGNINQFVKADHLPKGIYWVQLQHEKGVHTFKVVVQ